MGDNMQFSTNLALLAAMGLLLAAPGHAAVIGTNTPAPEVTTARLAELPAAERPAWADYIARSQRQRQFDRDTLAAELRPGETAPPAPTAGSGKMPLTRDAAWYATPEAREIADTIVSFQTPSGGWSKNQDRTRAPRQRGQRYANDAETMQLDTSSFDAPQDRYWTFVGTLDNGATTTEMRFLGRVQAQLPGKDGDAYRASIVKAVQYLLMSQYPNGGWPQNYPLEGGFHDGITFNDNAVAEAAGILEDIAEGHADFAFVPGALRQTAGAASARALRPILDAQVTVNGKKTVWPQQVDALTLQPISARNYEMRSLASAESAEVLLFLMRQPQPTPEVTAAIDAGAAWLKANAIYGKAFTKVNDDEGRKLVDKPGAGPIWSRNYDVRTGVPIFGDWDKSIQDDVNNISKGRRNGYSWYNAAPQKALDAYAAYAARQSQSASNQLPAGIEPGWLTPPPRPDTAFAPDALPARSAVLPVLDYVAAVQIADMSRRAIQLSTGSNLSEISSNWVAATFYVGAARLARVSSNHATLRFLTATAEHYNYALRGARADRTLLNADDVAIGDLYQELYARRGQQGVLMPLQQRLDFMLPHLDRKQDTPTLVWWWCDALYMAPPVLARQSALTGNPAYLRAMDREFRRTAARLWAPQDRLFLRDERFKDRDHLGAGGKPVYWARGNGWVMGGLARTLETMPANFKGREFYTDMFKAMASRVRELQQPDGLWRSDLNDPQTFAEPETSGSGFFVYALAWGINHGLLDRATYQPAVTRGWAALNRHILPNGLVGAAQKTGDRPVPTALDDVGPYATGAYLLAGLEIIDLHGPQQALPEPALARDDEATIAATTPQPVLPKTVVGPAEKARREQEMRATRALAYDPALLSPAPR
jgi:PelA/Pel-15E family pectate lyase